MSKLTETPKDSTSRESYCLILLMNTDYKIFTKILAFRLKACNPKLNSL